MIKYMKKSMNADAATAQTTAKKMTKTEIKENKMLAIRATIEEIVRPLTETADEFRNCVNKITHDEAGFTTPIVAPDILIENNVYQLCDMVIDSRMSADDKLYTLRLLEGLIYYVSSAGCIEGYSMCKNLWENMIRCDADYRIAKRNESKNMNKE